jgi:hypothetical protein
MLLDDIQGGGGTRNGRSLSYNDGLTPLNECQFNTILFTGCMEVGGRGEGVGGQREHKQNSGS